LSSGPRVQYPMVSTELEDSVARLRISFEIQSSEAVASIEAQFVIPGIGSFSRSFPLSKGLNQFCVDSSQEPTLVVVNPRLWWPWQMGEPHLHSLTIILRNADEISDQLTVSFGIRQV